MPRLSARLYSGKSMCVEMMCVRSERVGMEPCSPKGSKAAPSSSRLSRNYNSVNKWFCTGIRHALPYQSGLLAVELVAWDDRVAHTAKDQPAIFLLHLDSAVDLVLRESCKKARSCGVHGCWHTLSTRVAFIPDCFEARCHVACCHRHSQWGKVKLMAELRWKHLRCPQIRIRFRILNFVASSLTKLPGHSDNNGSTAGTPLATVA